MNRQVAEIKENNSGFTLLELVIAVAIMSIIVIVGGQFMVTSSNLYSSLQRSVSLSQASKQVTEQMSENSIDSSAAVIGPRAKDSSNTPICFVEYKGYDDNKSNSIQNSDDYQNNVAKNQYKLHVYKYDSVKQILYYAEVEDTTLDLLASKFNALTDNDYEPLCENVSGFSTRLYLADAESDRTGTKQNVKYVRRLHLIISLERRGRKFKSENDIYFRGSTLYTDSVDYFSTKENAEEVNER